VHIKKTNEHLDKNLGVMEKNWCLK